MTERSNTQIQVLKCSCLSLRSFEAQLLFQLDNFFQKPLELKKPASYLRSACCNCQSTFWEQPWSGGGSWMTEGAGYIPKKASPEQPLHRGISASAQEGAPLPLSKQDRDRCTGQ